MENILFSINTEYHVLVITSLIKRYYSIPGKYNITVLVNISSNNRFKESLNFSLLDAKVIVLKYRVTGKQFNSELHQTLKEITSNQWDKFIFFLEQAPVNQFLATTLSKKNTTICLAPEGTKPYINISKAALPSRIRATYQNYCFFKRQKLKTGWPTMVSNTHGFLKETDEVWVHNATAYNNITKKKVIEVELFATHDEVKLVSDIFEFDLSKEMPETNGVLFYLNQWYVDFKVYDYEIEVLQQILERYPEKKIYIKLHPNTHQFQVERLEKIDRVVLNRTTTPAEIFIINLKESIIFSFWSASLLVQNSSCKMYWLHKLLRKQNLMGWWSIANPTHHIVEVQSPNEITF